jgi:phosphoribosylanthranilate isomerase
MAEGQEAPPVSIKICGLRSYDEARDALDCGATRLGFLVGLTHRAEDGIDADTARAAVRRLPAAADTVLVTHLTDPVQVAELAAAIGVRGLQVHGPMSLPDLRRLRALVPGLGVLKAVHVTGEDAVAQALAQADAAPGLLLDSRTGDRLGGTGAVHDWSISARIVAALPGLPVHLAGGLTPDNVAEAIRQVRPAGVDVNSGVEDPRGRKDRGRMRRFVDRATDALGASGPG